MHSLWELSGAISNTIKNKRPLANWQVMHQMQCSREIIEPAGISWQEEWSGVLLLLELEMLRCLVMRTNTMNKA